MKLVIFGLTISSSWGNGHATLWRGLCRALAKLGHDIVFFERNVPYYAAHRDLHALEKGRLHLYPDWETARPLARRELSDADVAIVTSYCPDGIVAGEEVFSSRVSRRVFYDLDTPFTLAAAREGLQLAYVGPRGFADYDLVLSYTGGRGLEGLRSRLAARRVLPLYGSVDPEAHHPVAPVDSYRADLSYLGTYAVDRQQALQELFLEPAAELPECRFLIGGAQYPAAFPWRENIHFVRHLPPTEHSAFYCSSRLTLNVTRRAMREMGYCPSGRLFEAAACGVPLLSDDWEGLATFFQPEEELLLARSATEAKGAIQRSDEELARIARRARQRALDEYTAGHRVRELEQILSSSRGSDGGS